MRLSDSDRQILAELEADARPRFAHTYCSQCGGEFGPGDHGFSHCSSHAGMTDLDSLDVLAGIDAEPFIVYPDGTATKHTTCCGCNQPLTAIALDDGPLCCECVELMGAPPW